MIISNVLPWLQVNIDKNEAVALAGHFITMHIFATNTCVWFRVLFKETIENLEYIDTKSLPPAQVHAPTTPGPGGKCKLSLLPYHAYSCIY